MGSLINLGWKDDTGFFKVNISLTATSVNYSVFSTVYYFNTMIEAGHTVAESCFRSGFKKCLHGLGVSGGSTVIVLLV